MENYQFSTIQEGSVVAFSPGSTFIATAHLNAVAVHSAKSLQTVREWTCSTSSPVGATAVDGIKWSPDGSRLLVTSQQSECSWVFDLSRETPVACIEGPVVEATWGVDDIRIWTDSGITMYSVVSGSAKLIQQVHSTKHSFSPDRRYMAVHERHSGKDFIGIYDCESLIRLIPLQVTDVQCLSWSPCGRWIAVADWKLSYAVHVYSPVGTCLGEYHLPAAVLGVKHMSWSPSGRYVALGGYDGVVRVVESESWHPIAVLKGFETDVLIEPPERTNNDVAHCSTLAAPTRQRIPSEVSNLGFSADGTTLFFTEGAALHVYGFLTGPSTASPHILPQLSVMFSSSISDAQFCPTINRLVVVNNSPMVYLCNRRGVEGVRVPKGRQLRPTSVKWAPDGMSLALCDGTLYCVVYEEPGDVLEEHWEEDGDVAICIP